jgi:acid phosphatase type 7
MKSAPRWLAAGLIAMLWACSPAAAQTPADKEGLPTFVVPDVAKSIKIVAYGDVRFTDPEDNIHTNVTARRAIVAKVADEKPDALLFSGDMPYRGGSDDDWKVVDQEIKPIWDAKVRIYPALGNHEFMGDESRSLANWWKRFPELEGKRWYSVLFGNCYFIVLDSDSKLENTDPQQHWLDAQLARLPIEADFVFFVLHHPPYTDSHDHFIPGLGHSARKQEKRLAEELEQLQPKTRARFIVVAGHVHNYERFEHNSVTYIVTGGGGATPYHFDRSGNDKYQGGNDATYNYVRFEIKGTHLKATMLRLDTSSPEKTRFEEKDSFILDAVPLKNPVITGTSPAPR